MPANPPESATPLAEISQGPSKFEAFLDRNQKLLVIFAIALAVGTAAFVVYRGIEKSRQESAGAALIAAKDIDGLRSVINDHAGTRAAKSATLLLAEAQWDSDQKEASIATLEGFLADQSDHPAAATAKASLAARWMSRGESSKAVPLFQELLDDPEARHLAPYALICLGDIALAAGDRSTAENSYSRVLADYSASDYAGTANQRLNDLKAKPPVEVDPPAPEPFIPPSLERPSEGDDVPELNLKDLLQGGAGPDTQGAAEGAAGGALIGGILGGDTGQDPGDTDAIDQEKPDSGE